MNFKEILAVTLILFSVIDIVGSIPVIISIKRKVGKIQSGMATIASGVIMLVFLFVGEQILALFGVDIGSFAVAGSLIMFLIGLEMVLGVEFFKTDEDDIKTASIVPIAFPLIAGAGTMTTLISIRAEYALVNVLIGIVINLFFVYLVLKTSPWLEKKIGRAGLNVIRKVFGIILLSIAIKLFKTHLFI